MKRIAAGAAALALTGCDRTPAPPAAPIVMPPRAESGLGTAPAASTSVPSAASVFAPTAPPRPDPTAGRSNSTMSKAQESTAMPMPGQNNDHSAALGPAQRASAP